MKLVSFKIRKALILIPEIINSYADYLIKSGKFEIFVSKSQREKFVKSTADYLVKQSKNKKLPKQLEQISKDTKLLKNMMKKFKSPAETPPKDKIKMGKIFKNISKSMTKLFKGDIHG